MYINNINDSGGTVREWLYTFIVMHVLLEGESYGLHGILVTSSGLNLSII